MKHVLPLMLVVFTIFILGCASSPTPQVLQENRESTQQEITQTTKSLSGTEGLDEGNLPPDFKITSIDGKPVHIRSLGESGKPVVVYFFATWCPHCRNDFNALSEVYEDYKDDVEIVAMSLDLKEDAGKVSNYKSRYPKLEEVKFAPGTRQILSDYNVRYTTTKYAVNKEGQIIYRGSGEITPDQWRILLGELQKA